ncbi:MAG: dUTP diphosphatase [Crocinitomicaceae bacterium]|nr:dUTP diphosphatase [Crocinitomicaceae bacterium]MDC3134265.1 dUTP diphosphatase [Bacteroidota bacterium]PDH50054.1 MAG: dUTP diphosphatase [Bacteroidetes bacterium MED-G20]RPG81853.1 MAG: dUTP diphosphatase [Crocinitomicaceae bacterium TMED135]|tara:strand:+ start:2201 stop:2638 length:438 start_codon:yes stop_codon:yes gene_type:complete
MKKIKIVNSSGHPNPKLETQGSAGADLRAFINDTIIIKPFERKLIPTGLKLELPQGYEAQVRSRSGLALKNGIAVLNSPGTIDSDYRGDIGVILINLSKDIFTVNNGDRIAQIIIAKHEFPIFIETEKLKSSDRGESGFGSTGEN